MLKEALRRLGKDSLIYGLGGAISKCIGLLLLPLYTNALSPKEYGITALLSLLGVLMNGILTLGTGNSMGLLYFKETNLGKRPKIIWTNFTLMLSNGLLWYSLICFFSSNISYLMFQTNEYHNFIKLSFLTTVLTVITDPWLAYLRMERKAKIYLYLTLTGIAVNVALSFVLVILFKLGVYGLLLSGATGACIYVFLAWIFVGRKINFQLDKNLILPLIRIGFPSIFGVFAFLVVDYADRLMIERYIGLTQLGLYSVAYSFGLVVLVGLTAFGNAWPPFFMSYVNKQNEAKEVFGKVLTYYLLCFGSLVVLFFCVAKPLLQAVANPVYLEAWRVVGFIAGAYALKGCYLIMLPGIYFNNKLYLQSGIEWIAAILNIFLNIYLIPKLGILGAAIATTLSLLSLPFLAWFVSRSFLTVNYEWRRILFLLTTIIIASTTCYQISLLSSLSIYLNQIIISITFVIYLCILYFFLMKPFERNYVINIFKHE